MDRDIFVNKEFTRDNLNVVLFDNIKIENTQWKIILFSNPDENDKLKQMLKELLDFTQPFLFAVSIPIQLCISRVQNYTLFNRAD